MLPSPLDAHTSRRHAPALALLRRLGFAPVADVDYEGEPSARFTRTVPPA